MRVILLRYYLCMIADCLSMCVFLMKKVIHFVSLITVGGVVWRVLYIYMDQECHTALGSRYHSNLHNGSYCITISHLFFGQSVFYSILSWWAKYFLCMIIAWNATVCLPLYVCNVLDMSCASKWWYGLCVWTLKANYKSIAMMIINFMWVADTWWG